ncbi:MAG TPA: diacylglycerol kinase family protein [Steroidobacteraceae bacterium]|nr:diacylglycerol kinase family protein [Steroidobacteraceae bacterium]
MTDAVSAVDLAPVSTPGVATSGPRDGRWLVIHNPVAGRARNGRAWQDFERALRRQGLRFDVCTTRCAGDGARLAARGVRQGADRILVAGGDGSVHEVLNGWMRARLTDGANRSAPPLLVPVPLGTGNDWARSLRLPRDPDRLALLLASARPSLHDLGVIRFPQQGDETRWFVNVAGAGFDAHVIARVPAPTPSTFAYLAGALRELRGYRSPRFRISLDGGATREGRFLLAFVANGQYCGHRMHVAPPALLDDGRLDVVTIDEVGLARALPKLLKLYFGNVLRDPLVRHATAERVRIESDPVTAVEADGQLVGTTPADFRVERGALRVLRGP